MILKVQVISWFLDIETIDKEFSKQRIKIKIGMILNESSLFVLFLCVII